MSWNHVSSQPLVAELLNRSIQHGRIHHAYLLVGSESETELVATSFAKALNCEKNNGDFCDHCSSCLAISENRHPDMTSIRPASRSRSIIIDQLRDLERSIFLKASQARYKISIIHSADRMNENAQNAFLKTLEEPPPKTVFLLLSDEPQQLKDTVISRCLRIPFRPPPSRSKTMREQEIESWLDELVSFTSKIPPTFRAFTASSKLLNLFKEIKDEKNEIIEASVEDSVWDSLDADQRKKLEDQLAAQAQAEFLRERTLLLRGMLEWAHSRLQSVSAMNTIERLARQLSRNVNESLAIEIAMMEIANHPKNSS